MMNYALTIKKQSQHHFLFGPNLPCSLGSGWRFWDPVWKLGFCFDIMAINPSFITCDNVLLKAFISIRTVDKLFTNINMILFLIFIQQAQHKFGFNTVYVQIFSENFMTHGFWNSSFLCYFMNSQMTTGMNHFPNSLDVIFIFWCWRSSWMFIVLNWSSALFKMFVPFIGLCSTHGFIPKCLFYHFESLQKVFPNLKHNFTQTCCSWKSKIFNR